MSDLVPVEDVVGETTHNKAKIAFVIGLVGAIVTFVVAYFPDNNDVQTWGGLIAGLLTVVGTTYGVYQQSNFTSAAAVPVVRDERGVVNWIAVAAIGVLVIVVLMFFALFDVNGDDDKGNDGKRGLDWEIGQLR